MPEKRSTRALALLRPELRIWTISLPLLSVGQRKSQSQLRIKEWIHRKHWKHIVKLVGISVVPCYVLGMIGSWD